MKICPTISFSSDLPFVSFDAFCLAAMNPVTAKTNVVVNKQTIQRFGPKLLMYVFHDPIARFPLKYT